MNETPITLTLSADKARRLVAALMTTAWAPGSPPGAQTAACDLFAAYCQSYDADPVCIAESLPYSVEVHAKLTRAMVGTASPDGEQADD